MKLVSRTILAAAIAGSLLLAACGGGGGGGGSSSGGGGGGVIPTPTPPVVGAMHDNDGHGTNVAGIAAATANNAFGFAGIAYASPLQIYKVFPDPPAGCDTTTNPKACDTSASGTDEIKAIQDAVAHGAKVINLSLGSSGQSQAEASAIANAIASGVVVVAASGNGDSSNVGQPTLDCPACYAGVIAVGASSLAGNSFPYTEKVASYSNYDSANPSTWGIVAPGGDPSSGDPNLLHWIEGIFTSTPTDKAFQKPCKPDFGAASGALDCRILIAGTSQATPHVAGAAALLLSVGVAPASVKSLLCSHATQIGDPKSGCGRLNIYRAMAAAVGDSSLPAQSSTTYECSANGSPQSETRALQSMSGPAQPGELMRSVHEAAPSSASSNRLLVLYDRTKALSSRSVQLQSLQTQGLQLQSEMDMPHVSKVLRVVNVPAEKSVTDAMQQLRAQSGVVSVERDFKRSTQSTTAAITNDPYFKGNPGTDTPPFYESANVGGQWDAHVVCAANAWAYGQSHPGAAGGTVPIAIIDTGADLTHGDLTGRATVTEVINSGNGTVTP